MDAGSDVAFAAVAALCVAGAVPGRQRLLQVVQWKPWQKYVFAPFDEPALALAFFFAAARNTSILGECF